MYNHNKAQQSKNRVHISWDILYVCHSTLKSEWNRNQMTDILQTTLFDDSLCVMMQISLICSVLSATLAHRGWTAFHGKCPMYDFYTLDLRMLRYMDE